MKIINKKYILFLLAFLGLAVSVELTYIYFKANFLPGAGPSFCTLNEYIDCDAVARTTYSTFLGVPQSIWGMCFYSFIMFLSIFPFNKFKFFENFKNPESYIFTLSSFSVLFSINLWLILSFLIHKVCLLCYVLYFVNIMLFLFSGLGKPIMERYKESFTDFIKIISDPKWLAIVILLFISMTTTLIIVNISKLFIPQEKYEINFQPTGNILGAENPKLIINEFTDFQCPYCAISNSMLLRLVSEVQGVRVEHHDFPLNKECNSLVKGSPHKFGCKAAFYARAAKNQGKYWDYITLLFDNQQDLSDAKFIELAKSINLDIEQFKKDANSPEVKEGVKEDVEMAKGFGITATPTYIIGIKKYEGIMPYPELKATVESNLY